MKTILPIRTYSPSVYRSAAIAGLLWAGLSVNANAFQITPVGTYETGFFDAGAAEIVAHDPESQRLFVANATVPGIDILSINSLPGNPTLVDSIDVSGEGKQANSVAVKKGIVVAAVENDNKQLPGKAVFYDTSGNPLAAVTVGALPDMVIFTDDGNWVLVANEGEPNDDYTVDPEGSVSVIDMRGINVDNLASQMNASRVRTADFTRFTAAGLPSSIRIFGPNATVAQDLEPEYITTFKRGNQWQALITLQENNGLALVDVQKARVIRIIGLGFKSHMEPRNKLDASNEDGTIRVRNWPVYGMYQPDSLASYRVRGVPYIVLANEGDAREYEGTPGFNEETRVKDAILDPSAFPNAAELQLESNLGRLKTTNTLGDRDNDGDTDALFSFGARSFSIRRVNGTLVYDSGDQLEQITASVLPDNFNASDDDNAFDDRSDDKGPEPEGVVVGEVDGRFYAFIGLERIGGIAIYDVTEPRQPFFIRYINTRDFSQVTAAGDLSPEGLAFVAASDSPTGNPLLVVSFEISGTTTVFEITD